MSHELTLDRVTKSFDGYSAMREVSFTVTSGERVAIVGPSGAGKTTLLRLASGAIAPDSGRVSLDGEPVDGRVALAYHGDTLIGRRSALSNVLVGRIGGLSWWRGLLEPLIPAKSDPAFELLEAMGMADKANARVDSLSGGERQRIALARALIQDAPVLLADEPTTNLDPKTSKTVLDVLDASVAGRVLVAVLHDTDLARERFERVIGVADGRIQFDQPAWSVSDNRLDRLFESDNGSEASGETDLDREPTARAANDNASDRSNPPWYV